MLHLPHLGVVRFEGDPAKVSKFINDYTSNMSVSLFNSFLDREGKIVVVFLHFNVDGEYLIAMPNRFYNRLEDHLQVYLDLSDIRMSKTNYTVYSDIGTSSICDAKLSYIKFGDNLYFAISHELLPHPIDNELYSRWRITFGYPEQGVDFDREVLLNIFPTSYVSFDKGCYLGQEVIARIHYKGKPSRKLSLKKYGKKDSVDRSAVGAPTTLAKHLYDNAFHGFTIEKNN